MTKILYLIHTLKYLVLRKRQMYMELSNCQEGLMWLFQAEEEETTYHRVDELKKDIDICLSQVNSLQRSNLNTK